MTARDSGRVGLAALVLAAVAFFDGMPGVLGQGRPAQADQFAGLSFRNIGPATMGGRVDDLAVLESNPAVFYVATATGGLWKTTNNATTWEVLFDDQDDVVSIGDVAIAPNDANLVWVGTGENNNRQSGSWGNGIYKSTDGGQTWKHMGLTDTKHIARVIVDPVDHDVVYVAALGHLWGPNKERGVFKTTDGGLNWTSVLYVDDDTGATELVMDPSNNKVLYAASYQRRRATWGFNGGGPGSGIYKSSDAGRSWTRLTNGIPTGQLGRIGMDIYRKNPSVVYARIEHERESGTYRSDDAGATWRRMSDVNPRPMYFSQVRIDPNNDNRIYVLGVQLHLSDDGGRTFTNNGVLHSDHHAMWINPANSNHVITGNDGGIGISYDRGKTWEAITNMDLGQFYHVGYDMDTPYRVYGGLQDNYSWGGPSAVRSRQGILNDDWSTIQGGDGFEAIVDPKDSRTIYTESQDGNIVRVDRVTNERKAIRPLPARGEPALRWNWNAPIVISPHNSSTVLVAANKVFKSTDRGHSWTAISQDLTANVDRETLSLMNVVAKDFRLAKHDGVQSYGNLVALAESPKKPGLIYTGADDGTVHVTRDGGANWTNISTKFPALPKGTYVSRLVPSAFEEAVVYASFDGHRGDDYGTYVYMSTDAGNSWKSITSNVPKGHTVVCLTEDPKNANVLYVGTEFAVFVTLDRGGSWMRLRAGLPTVPIHEIVIHPRENDMIVATHGRSLWILDDIMSIQQAGEAMKTDAHLFDLRPAQQFIPANDRGFIADKVFRGNNPAFGATVSYWLKKENAEVALRIQSGSGQTVRELTGNDVRNARKSGINRLQWDLRHQPLPAPRGEPAGGRGGGGGGGFGGGGLNGPFVLPDEYRVTLVVDGRDVATKAVAVKGDPAVQITDADRKTMHDTALALHGMQRTANETAEAVTALGEHFQAVEALVRSAQDAPPTVKTAIQEMNQKLVGLRRRLGVQVPGQGAQGPGGPAGFGGGRGGGGRGGGGGGGRGAGAAEASATTTPAPAQAAPESQQGRGGGGFGFGGAAQNVRGQIGTVKGQIMNSTSLPTAQQTRTVNDAREDLEKVVQETNDLILNGMPALYTTLGANNLRPPALKAIRTVVTTSSQ